MNLDSGTLALDLLPMENSGTAKGVGSGPWLGAECRSVYETQEEILAAIARLHCPEWFDADLTYGNGSFWKKSKRPKHCFDLTPLSPGVTQADSRNLPLETASIKSAVFDPPFLTYVKNGRDHKGGKVAMTARFGGYYTYGELEAHYTATLSEAYRVLKPLGRLVFKCQDVIHNHKMHCTHANVIAWAQVRGFRVLDLFILPARSRMTGPQLRRKGTQRHARVWHSYFLVFERDRSPFADAPNIEMSNSGPNKTS
jgi:hypothetical protein